MDRIFLLYLYSRWYIAYVIQIGIENISIFEWAKFDSIVGKQALKRFDRFFIFTSYQTEDYRLRIIEDYGMSYSFSMDFGFSLKLLGFYDLASKFDLGFSLQIMDFIVASNFGFDRSLWIFIFRSKNPKTLLIMTLALPGNLLRFSDLPSKFDLGFSKTTIRIMVSY